MRPLSRPHPLTPELTPLIAALCAAALPAFSSAGETSAPADLQITWHGTAPELRWNTGLLLQSDTLLGPWLPLATATSPHTPSPGPRQQFFRLVPPPGTAQRTAEVTTSGLQSHRSDLRVRLDHHRDLPLDPQGRLTIDNLSEGTHRLQLDHPWYEPLELQFSTSTPIPQISPDYTGKPFRLGSSTYRVVGHSGGSPTGGYNSLAACLEARSQGVAWMEIDTLSAADGIPVCFHDWPKMLRDFDLDQTATSSEIASAGIMTTPDCLARFSHLILDLIHNSSTDIARIVDYLDANFPERIRSDVVLQVYKRIDYDYIHNLDPSIRISFNLASWSTTLPYGDAWPQKLADVFASTDFYVINPTNDVTPDLLRLLRSNGRDNTFVAVMHDHDPNEITRLSNLGAIPMLWDIREAPASPAP